MVDELLRRHPDWMRSISMTTRAPRPGEIDGKDYFFVNLERFEALDQKAGLLESAQVHQNRYGTPRLLVESQVAAGKVVFLTVDVQGARKIKSLWADSGSLMSVFIMPTSMDVLRERLLRRNTEKPEQIEIRLAAAQQEIEQAPFYDFSVYNHNLDQTVGEIEELILAFRQKLK